MIRGKDNILTWFKNIGCNYWTIYQYGKSDSSCTVMKSNPEDTASDSRAYQELYNALDLLDGKYTMACTKEKTRSPRQDYREDIEVSRAGIHGIPVQQGTVSGISKEEAQRMVEEGIAGYKKEMENEAMRKRVAELEKTNKQLEKAAASPWAKLVTILEPYAPAILGSLTKQVAGIPEGVHTMPTNDHLQHETTSIIEETQTMNLTPEQEARLAECISTFYNAAPGEWLDILEKMAAKVQANPAILGTIKAFL